MRHDAALFVLFGLCAAIGCGEDETFDWSRDDGASQIEIDSEGSLQNAAWSPDSDALLFTAFRSAYNDGPADLVVADSDGGSPHVLVSDGSDNVNLPGSSWSSATEQIVFSSSRDPHDEIFAIDDNASSGDEWPITSRDDFMAYEPTFSPDGEWVVFESHAVDQEDNGVITRFRVDGSGDYEALTSADDDCRQPNWSPAGDKILYQRLADGTWDIWVMNDDGTDAQRVTSGQGDKTDASFSPDGDWIVYSSDENELDLANLFVVPVDGGASTRVTEWPGYDGAPSWSPDGSKIAFESFPGDPDDSDGTRLYVIDAPEL